MEVILQEDFPSLGYVGDKVSVRGGYARNFLIPRGIALESSADNQRMLKHRLGAVQAKKIKLRSEAEAAAKSLEAVTLEFTLKLGERGKSFGSITSKDIEKALADKGFALDKRQIRLVEPFRGAGVYTVDVKLHSEVIAKVPVKVTAETPPKREARPEGEEKKSRSRARKEEEGTEESQNAAGSDDTEE